MAVSVLKVADPWSGTTTNIFSWMRGRAQKIKENK